MQRLTKEWKIPKHVVPKKDAYEYLLGECGTYVRLFGGRIWGEVDYQKWQAPIDMYLAALLTKARHKSYT